MKRLAGHRPGYTSTLRQSLVVEPCDEFSRGSEGALDPQRDIGNYVGLNLKLTVVEHLEYDCLG